ncbi:ABC transporter permease [Yinghuangia seranimata]|uniref:ABC transporter permease n=1 Tax=Yinghuangia seranimata TaxID=408067 RepID=UPI00248CDAAD|nr:ABC transporter permease [Yinghuangia seranimata]MDI2128411.1 ABC transporter permease [Yinghuangia seranimata]
MIRLAWANLRFHATGFIASFIALFLGAVIVIGCGGLLETGIRADAPPRRLAEAPILVAGDQSYRNTRQELVFPERVRLDAGLTTALAAAPRVADTAADVSFPAVVVRDGGTAGARGDAPRTTVTGHGWSSARLTPYRVVQGERPAAADQIVLDADTAARAGIRPGDHVTLLVHGTAARYRISGLASPARQTAAVRDAVFFSDAEADRVSGLQGRVDAIAVFPAAGADVRQVVRDLETMLRTLAPGTPVSVLTGDDRGRAEDPSVLADSADLIPLAAAFGGLAAMVTVFVVAGTLGLSIRQRQREMALLRAMGATPGRVRRMVVGEAMMLALPATALAWWPGPHFGRLVLDRFTDAGVVPDSIAFRSGTVPAAVGIGVALLTALVSALVAGSTAARARPVEALAETGFQRRRFSRVRLVTGVLCAVGGVLLARGTAGSDGPDAAGVATPAVMVWAAAFGLLGPPMARGLAALLRSPLRRTGVAGELAAANAQARPSRLAAAALPVMLATGLALSLVYIHETESEGSAEVFAAGQRADLVVSSAAGGLPAGAVDDVRAVPGVAAATAQLHTTGYLAPTGDATALTPDGAGEGTPQPVEVPLYGVTPVGLGSTTSFRAATGDLGGLSGRTVALSTRHAEHRAIGDVVPMRLGDGTRVDLTLVATFEARPGYESALVPAALLLDHTDAGLLDAVMVRIAPDADRTAVATSLGAALADRYPGVAVSGREALAATRAAQDRTQTTMANLVLAVVVGYAAISLANTQILSVAERRRELALLRLVGASRRQVLRSAAAEASLVAVTGILLGGAVAALTLVPVGLSVLDSPVPGGSVWPLATTLVVAALLTTVTTLLATAAVLRRPPMATAAHG